MDQATSNSTPEPRGGDAVTEGAPASSGGRFWLFVLGLAALALLGGGGLAFTQYGRLAQAAPGSPADAEADEARPAYGAFTELKGLIANPAGTGGTRYLAVSIGFEADGPEVLAELERKEIVVRDAVLSRLSQRTAAELSAIDQRGALKEELRTTVNDVLEEGAIRRLYFTQYVLQ